MFAMQSYKKEEKLKNIFEMHIHMLLKIKLPKISFLTISFIASESKTKTIIMLGGKIPFKRYWDKRKYECTTNFYQNKTTRLFFL